MEFKLDNLERQVTKLVVLKDTKLPHGQFEAVLSTDQLDRHGEIVDVKGMVIPKDQVIKMYYNHQTSGDSLPIGLWLKIWKTQDGKLMGRGQIDVNDPFAMMIYSKIQNGFIDSISVGFYPKEFDGDTSTWTKSELVEASVVAEPANVGAKITAKELGFSADEFEQSLKVKLAETKDGKVAIKQIRKGAVMDVLVEQDKWEVMEDFWEVVYAFADAYYDVSQPTSAFNQLLTETIGILQSIVDGTYQDPDDTDEDDAGAVVEITEMQAAVEELKSKVGSLEAAVKASDEQPAIKTLIQVRLAGKEVDKTAEAVNRAIKVQLKELNNE